METEDSFSDDDLDDIPDNTLRVLEQQALHSTQLSRTLPWRPPSQKQQQAQQHQHTLRHIPSEPPLSAPRPASSDYGFDDEHIIDMDEPSMVIQPASGPASRPASFFQPRPASPSNLPSAPDAETEAAFAAADAELGGQDFGRWAHAAPPSQHAAISAADVSALQAKIAELEMEQARLRKSEQQARDEVQAKQGEIAIVRSNQEQAVKRYEARISVMQQLQDSKAAEAQSELEAARKEREKLETDNRFLQHDLVQEASRAKRWNDASRTRSLPRETPKKNRRAQLGDGFDDNEVRMASPSKSKDKTRGDQTPKAGAKRKRPAPDSPVPALSFTQPRELLHSESTEKSAVSVESTMVAPAAAKEDVKYEFIQRLLNHCPGEGHETTVESLAKYSFPSKPGKSLSSLFIHDISNSATPTNDALPLKVSKTLLGLWSRCLEERYFGPFYLILELLCFTLQSELSSLKSQLIEQAVPLCTQSIDLIAVPIARASTNREFAATLDREAIGALAEELDVERVLELLQDFCNAATLSGDRIEGFWKIIEPTFLLLLLNKALPISQIIGALQIVAASVRETTFGSIAADSVEQEKNERAIVDKLTNLLFEMPDVPIGEEPYTDEEIMELRVEVLQVFMVMCETDHGGLLLTRQRFAIGRLVRFLDTQVSKLYSTRPSLGLQREDSGPNAHDSIIESVNLTVRILYHLLRTYEGEVEIVPKLHAVKGGYHKFLVSLTRIAFSEQLVLEAGINDEVAEAAHNILDAVLGPEDGEAVMQAMATPRGTRGSASDRPPQSASPQNDNTTMPDPE